MTKRRRKPAVQTQRVPRWYLDFKIEVVRALANYELRKTTPIVDD